MLGTVVQHIALQGCVFCKRFSIYSLLFIVLLLLAVVPEVLLQSPGTTTATVSPIATGHVRLVNDYRDYSGVIEIQVDGEWGPLCQHDLGHNEAKVICRQLGYRLGYSEYGEKSSYIYDEVFFVGLSCNGHEANISACSYTTLRGSWQQCRSSYEVGTIVCNTGNNESSGVSYDFFGLIVMVFFVIAVSIVWRQRYRRRGCFNWRNQPTHQTTVVTTGNSVQGVAVPPPTATSYSAAPPGSYPAQAVPNQYPHPADRPPQYHTVVQPNGGVAPYPQGGTPYPPQGGGVAPYPLHTGSAPYPPHGGSAPYPPQGGSVPYPSQGGGAPYPPETGAAISPAQPYPSGPAANPAYPPPSSSENPAFNPAFPPSNYTPTLDTPSVPPPAYESIADNGKSTGQS